MLQDEFDGGYRQRNTQVIRGGKQNAKLSDSKMDKSENDYLLTGHGKITFNL